MMKKKRRTVLTILVFVVSVLIIVKTLYAINAYNQTIINVSDPVDAQDAATKAWHTANDDDVPESGDFGAAGDLEANGTVSANAVALGTDTTGNYANGDGEAGNLQADTWKSDDASMNVAYTTTEAGSLRCDGQSDMVTTTYAGIGGNADRSISFWVNCDDPVWGRSIVSYGGDLEMFDIASNTAGGTIIVNHELGIDAGTTDVQDNTWHFVCITFDGTADIIHGYIDGGADEFNDLRVLNTEAADDFNIGGRWDENSWAHEGFISDVMFWDDDLSEAEAAAVEALGRNPTYAEVETLDFEDTDLVSWWRLVFDATDSWAANHGTFQDEAHVEMTAVKGLTANEPVFLSDPSGTAGPFFVNGTLSVSGPITGTGGGDLAGNLQVDTLEVNGELIADHRAIFQETDDGPCVIGISAKTGYDSSIRFYENGVNRGGIYHDASSNDVKITTIESGADIHLNGDDDVYSPDIYGQVLGGTTYDVHIKSTGQLGRISSSKRFKDHEGYLEENKSKFMQLKPAKFCWDVVDDSGDFVLGDNGTKLAFGFYAEDVNDVYPELARIGLDSTPDPNRMKNDPAYKMPKVRVQDYDPRGLQAVIVTEMQAQQQTDDIHLETILLLQVQNDAQFALITDLRKEIELLKAAR